MAIHYMSPSVWAAITKVNDWGAYKKQKFLSHSSEGWKSEIKCPADSASGGGLFPGSQTAVSWLGPYRAEGARELPRVSWIRVLITSVRAPPARPNILPKAPPPYTITLGFRFQHTTLGVTNHQAIALHYKLTKFTSTFQPTCLSAQI